MKEIDLKIETIQVKSETKSLRSKWTYEILQDVASYKSNNIEKELNSIWRAERRKNIIQNIFIN